MGPSIIAWRGPCDISFQNMADGEDLLNNERIAGSDMVHFIFEMFDEKLISAVLLQRLFASIVSDVVTEMAKPGAGATAVHLRRNGDDLYYKKQKLSISIAVRTTNSVMIHFAVNVVNKGTPVATCALSDWQINPKSFAQNCLRRAKMELDSIQQATWKVKSV